MLQWVRVYESFQCDLYLKLKLTELLRMKLKYCDEMSTVSPSLPQTTYLHQYNHVCLL